MAMDFFFEVNFKTVYSRKSDHNFKRFFCSRVFKPMTLFIPFPLLSLIIEIAFWTYDNILN